MSDLYRESRTLPPEGIWHSLNKFLLTLIVLSASIPIGYSFLPEVNKRKNDELRIEELKAQVEQEQMRLHRLALEERLLKHDPEYVGVIARDRLGLMDKGETIYRIDSAKPDLSNFRRNP